MFAVPLSDTLPAELRPLEPWHAAEFLAHMDRARENLDRFIGFAALSTDLASARATLQRYADRAAADTGRIYGIWLDGTLVGGVMFPHFEAVQGWAEIGVWVEPAGEGLGLVSAGVRELIEYALVERGLHRVEWLSSTLNDRSRAVARRAGLTLEGVRRSYYPHNGIRHDKEVWALLTDEWLGSPQRAQLLRERAAR
ncbi:RimJ/RimL family protein N-acetyltransferase [Streptomyces tateyamensis]|uniref:RimJ/RimL family protein N-acetyltransferase n=1 Tax=Streptomyces tateyamensis TaxID=565073 RepID=A0A2V4NZ57_9ACTN|nr:GNAT family protein [Streptomyces tateyamensis]PYC87496.1 RimJ/RimL family protein N-acetyltransferase [Streptomyces tateyamensis]